MNSFIIVKKSSEDQRIHALQFCKDHTIDPLDTIIINTPGESDAKEIQKTPKGIALIRHIHERISLTPLRGEKKALIVLSAESLSIPAQNALLKLLEEPPKSTFIILTTDNESLLLPTIRSRCQSITDDASSQVDIHYESFLLKEDSSLSSALQKAEDLAKQKESVLQFLENEMVTIHSHLHEHEKETSEKKRISLLLSHCLSTYKLVKTTNINVRFALENLFLSI